MKRIDIIYQKLTELSEHSGVTTEAIADSLGLSRANVSSDLNQLCAEDKAAKEGTRPVLYKAVLIETNHREGNILDELVQKNPSLFTVAEQAKAAILYPPKGMHILILGETGTGKSMLAKLIHQYALEMERMEKNSPFIVFNCADYASNPQLLLSQLFGTKKGAYTGADSDKPGLIDKANGGALFLDEIHRLPPEGQEMFFTFMDTATYRRLGETDTEHMAKVLIISATTEDPDSSLLKTFTRRIPMVLHMPNLHERNMEERFNLICQFFREESFRLEKPVLVSVNSMKSFLSYRCPNNIGQLKTDIQLACAKAYADLVSNKRDAIKINSINLPGYIREGLYAETGHRQLWNKFIGINKRYCIFDSSEEQILFEEEQKNIYEMIDKKVRNLKNQGVSNEQLEEEMEKDIKDFFSTYLQTVNKNTIASNLESIINPNIIQVVEKIIQFSEKKLEKTFNNSIRHGMAVHISNSIERVRRNKKIVNPQLNKIRAEYNEEFSTAVECLKIISNELDIDMPIDEAGFLTMFFVYNDENTRESKHNVNIIIITHGTSTATSLAETANNLLGVDYAVGFNAPLDEQPQQVISKLKAFIKENHIQSNILFLVDMGSLTNFGDEIETELNIETKTIPLVSTLHVIQATRKAMLGYSLDQVYEDTLQVNELLENDYPTPTGSAIPESQEKLAIVSVCTTGEGCAALIQKILEENLKTNLPMKIIPISLISNESIQIRLKNIEKQYRLLCLVSPFRINSDIRQFDIDGILNKTAIQEIQRLIDIENTYIKIGDTFENHFKNVSGKIVCQDIHQFIRNVENALNIRIPTSILIGIAFHLGCLIDKLKGNDDPKQPLKEQRIISENPDLYAAVKKECEVLNHKYMISISEEEMVILTALLDPEKIIGPKAK